MEVVFTLILRALQIIFCDNNGHTGHREIGIPLINVYFHAQKMLHMRCFFLV